MELHDLPAPCCVRCMYCRPLGPHEPAAGGGSTCPCLGQVGLVQWVERKSHRSYVTDRPPPQCGTRRHPEPQRMFSSQRAAPALVQQAADSLHGYSLQSAGQSNQRVHQTTAPMLTHGTTKGCSVLQKHLHRGADKEGSTSQTLGAVSAKAAYNRPPAQQQHYACLTAYPCARTGACVNNNQPVQHQQDVLV